MYLPKPTLDFKKISSQKGSIIPVITLIIIAVGLLATTQLVKLPNIFRSRADSQTPAISVINSFGLPIDKTSSQEVKVRVYYEPKITSPVEDTPSEMKVLVLKYFPLDTLGRIDINITGDVSDSYESIKLRTDIFTPILARSIEKASTYLGYKDENAKPALRYSIVDTKEYKEAVPIKPRGEQVTYPDYEKIMSDHNICNYVDNFGVSEVWLWAYQGSIKEDTKQPSLGISESKMSGPYGDTSNSPQYNEMPICSKTYRVYTFNYGTSLANALESWGHQFENEIDAVDEKSFYLRSGIFRGIFQGYPWPQCDPIKSQDFNDDKIIDEKDKDLCRYNKGDGIGRCGSAHNPPNARFEYDRSNPTPVKSDCLNWNPDNPKELSDISCTVWGCDDKTEEDNSALNYQIWMWQNLPGMNNKKTYLERPLRNFWQIHASYDEVIFKDKTLYRSGRIEKQANLNTYPSHFRLANSLAELTQATPQLYSPNMTTDWTLTPEKGSKQIYVQFKINNNWITPSSTSIILGDKSSPTPVVTHLPPVIKDPPRYRQNCGNIGGKCAASNGITIDRSTCQTYRSDIKSCSSSTVYPYCYTDCSEPTATPPPAHPTICPDETQRKECVGYSGNGINMYCWGENNTYLGGVCNSSCPKADECSYGEGGP